MSKITDYSFLFQSMLGGNGIVLDSGGWMHGVGLMKPYPQYPTDGRLPRFPADWGIGEQGQFREWQSH